MKTPIKDGVLQTDLDGNGKVISNATFNGTHVGDGSGLTGVPSGTAIPTGVITMWYGSIASIPSGWLHCDGTNGTPDLRNRFPVGANADDAGVAKSTVVGAAAQTGGANNHTHTITDPGHDHPFTDPGHTHGYIEQDLTTTPGSEANVAFDTGTTQSNGTGATVDSGPTGITNQSTTTVPPFYALTFIMKA